MSSAPPTSFQHVEDGSAQYDSHELMKCLVVSVSELMSRLIVVVRLDRNRKICAIADRETSELARKDFNDADGNTRQTASRGQAAA